MDLVPQPGIKPGLPALQVRSLSHWTTREVPWKVLNVADAGLHLWECGQPWEGSGRSLSATIFHKHICTLISTLKSAWIQPPIHAAPCLFQCQNNAFSFAPSLLEIGHFGQVSDIFCDGSKHCLWGPGWSSTTSCKSSGFSFGFKLFILSRTATHLMTSNFLFFLTCCLTLSALIFQCLLWEGLVRINDMQLPHLGSAATGHVPGVRKSVSPPTHLLSLHFSTAFGKVYRTRSPKDVCLEYVG